MRAGRSAKNGAVSAATDKTAVGVAHPRQILLAGLLDDGQPRAQRRIERLDRGGHHIGHDARALAAAENKKPQPIGHRRIGRGSGGDDRGPHRIAGQRRLGGKPRLIAKHVRKGRGDGGHARRQQPVGAADHGIRVMDDGRHAAPSRRQNRRQRRIAAEADHRRRLEPSDQRPGLHKPRGKGCGSLRHGDRIARRAASRW